MDDGFDLICVGGGVGGAGLAAVMARNGYRCLVLEATAEFRDRTKGEWMAPWGVLEARRTGLEDDVTRARGHFITRHVGYDEFTDPAESEARALDLGFLPGVAGPLTQRHPDLCQSLLDAAGAAGAEVHRGTTVLGVQSGASPSVEWSSAEGVVRRDRARLIIGADGRNSVVRRDLGITLVHAPAHHLFSGLLVDGADGWPESTQTIGTEGELHYLAFPQGSGRVRLYLGFALDRKRFVTGPDGPQRFLEAFRLKSLPGSAAFADAKPVSPCATYPNEDAWCDEPFAEGVILIGDAAGWNDPITGQGLSITMRDIRVVSELLCSEADWTPAAFAAYGEERKERMRRLRFAAALASRLVAEFGPEAGARRRRYAKLVEDDPMLLMTTASAFIGPELAPAEAFTPERWELLTA